MESQQKHIDQDSSRLRGLPPNHYLGTTIYSVLGIIGVFYFIASFNQVSVTWNLELAT